VTSESSAHARFVDRAEFRRGFVAIIPLWFGAIPFAIAYAVLAQESGLTKAETVSLSLFVMAGAAQLAFIDLASENAAWIAILATVLLLNLRHVLYGLSLNEKFPATTHPPRPVLAQVLTDENYGLTIRDYLDGCGSPGFMFGSGVSLLGCFFVSTVIGVILGGFIPDTERLGLDFIFPLTFLALLLPLLRSRRELFVAAVGGVTALLLSRETNGGVTILVSTILAAGAGALLPSRETTI
jgi:4-azaleucine resistance transporter AzlC